MIVVSEDGPVTVMRAGHLMGASAMARPEATGELLQRRVDRRPEPRTGLTSDEVVTVACALAGLIEPGGDGLQEVPTEARHFVDRRPRATA